MRWYIIGKKAFKRIKVTVTMTLVLSLVALFTYSVVNARGESLAKAAMSSNATQAKTVVIDAGHGGEDCGAVGVSGVYEKDLNLAIANELGTLLEERGYKVIYTRTEDKLLYTEAENIKGLRKISDLKNRVKIANQFPNAIFVSIHMNSYAEAKYSGLQVYYTDGDDKSQRLAGCIQNAVHEELQKDNDRVIKSGRGLYLLDNTDGVSVLVECGFITNPDECARLSEKEYQKQLCLSIVCGIIKYNEGK